MTFEYFANLSKTWSWSVFLFLIYTGVCGERRSFYASRCSALDWQRRLSNPRFGSLEAYRPYVFFEGGVFFYRHRYQPITLRKYFNRKMKA